MLGPGLVNEDLVEMYRLKSGDPEVYQQVESWYRKMSEQARQESEEQAKAEAEEQAKVNKKIKADEKKSETRITTTPNSPDEATTIPQQDSNTQTELRLKLDKVPSSLNQP